MNKYANTYWVVEIPKYTIGMFVMLNILSIIMYSGGTYFNNANLGYSMEFNFLSDLGRTVSFSNNNNFISSFLFNSSLVLSAFVFIMFFIKYNIFFKTEN